MTDDEKKLARLLDAVDDVIRDAGWYPADEFGTPEMLVPSDSIKALIAAYAAFDAEEEG